ncbi:MAG: asparaginase [Thermoanaerobaculia bacterium]
MGALEAFRPLAVSRRGGLAESWHGGAIAVVGAGGSAVASVGDPAVATFARSAAKPFQAIAMLGFGLSRWELDDADLALVCASHSGMPVHVARAAALLERAGLDEGSLRCGAHRPLDEDAARDLDRAGRLPGALENNCSGKHAGMLLACLAAEADRETYLDVDHPLQRRVLDEVARFAGLAPERVGIGVDGCGVPAFHLPLRALALAYARLAAPETVSRSPEHEGWVRRVHRAMTAAPEMVAGPGRFTTALMCATDGRLLAKEGAQGVYAVSLPDPGRGLVVKIADGGETCRDAVVLEALHQLDALSDAELLELAPYRSRTLRNWVGREVGDVVVDFRLRFV